MLMIYQVKDEYKTTCIWSFDLTAAGVQLCDADRLSAYGYATTNSDADGDCDIHADA
jgi:hypothetical protein